MDGEGLLVGAASGAVAGSSWLGEAKGGGEKGLSSVEPTGWTKRPWWLDFCADPSKKRERSSVEEDSGVLELVSCAALLVEGGFSGMLSPRMPLLLQLYNGRNRRVADA